VVTSSAKHWVILLYRVPPQPTAGRVGVWRKLKRLGALLLHDSVWVLPASPRSLEQFQWLVAEISECGGEAMLWEGSLCLDGQEDTLVDQFVAQVNRIYEEIEQALGAAEPDLSALSRRYQQARQQDFFHSERGQRVRDALLKAEGGSEP
jgi:hypothetical protein